MEYLATIEDFISASAVAPSARPGASGRAIEPSGSFAEALGFVVLAIVVRLAMHALKALGRFS
jgi:hypothetical protein